MQPLTLLVVAYAKLVELVYTLVLETSAVTGLWVRLPHLAHCGYKVTSYYKPFFEKAYLVALLTTYMVYIV